MQIRIERPLEKLYTFDMLRQGDLYQHVDSTRKPLPGLWYVTQTDDDGIRLVNLEDHRVVTHPTLWGHFIYVGRLEVDDNTI